jgi:hypothetical protein
MLLKILFIIGVFCAGGTCCGNFVALTDPSFTAAWWKIWSSLGAAVACTIAILFFED